MTSKRRIITTIVFLGLVALIEAQSPCSPINYLGNQNLTSIATPLLEGDYFEAHSPSLNNSITFKVFPAHGYHSRYDITVFVYKGKCSPNATAQYSAKSKSNSIIKPDSKDYTIFVLSGFSGAYQLQFCEGECEDFCENDCTYHGYCNTTSLDCSCLDKWKGNLCQERAPMGRFYLFGSLLVGIIIIIVLPAILTFLLIVCIVACWFQNKRKDRRTEPIIIYQKFPYQPIPDPESEKPIRVYY